MSNPLKMKKRNNLFKKADHQNFSPTAKEIELWISEYIADLLDIEADEIDTEASFDAYSLDSSMAIGLTGDLENWLKTKLDPTLLYDYPTIQTLAEHLNYRLTNL